MIQILEGIILIEDKDIFLKKIKKISEKQKIVIQVLDADKLAGEEHLRFAVQKAIKAFENGKNIAQDLSKEILLYVSGTRQISKAVRMGVHNGINNIAVVSIGENIDISAFLDITPKNVLGYDASKNSVLMDIFGITQEEIKCAGQNKIPDLVLERVALVDILK